MINEILEIISELNDSPETKYINEMKKQSKTNVKIIDLTNGSKRYFVKIDGITIEKTSKINFTHVLIGKENKGDKHYMSFGFSSNSEVTLKKFQKLQDKTFDLLIVKLDKEVK